MASFGVAGLQFPWRELVDETSALREMAADLFVWDGPLKAFERGLARIGEQSAERDWTLELQPLRTKPTSNYECGSKSGGPEIYAHVTGKWELRPVGLTRPNRMVAFTGTASAVVELWPAECQWCEKHNGPSRLAMWRIELGAHDSPGCYFHCQVLGDLAQSPFPKSVPIPRLPSPFVYPDGSPWNSCWESCSKTSGHGQQVGATHSHKRWRAIQQQRWSSLIQWQKDTLDRSGSSPWMNLKSAKPPDDLFLPS